MKSSVSVILIMAAGLPGAFGQAQSPGPNSGPPASSVISRPASVDQRGPAAQPRSALSGVLGSLSHDQVALGLKQALTNGVQTAIRELGHQDGFLTNLAVRIPMPKQLRTIEETLRTLKEDKLADEFVAAMNHAAEKAVPEGVSIF